MIKFNALLAFIKNHDSLSPWAETLEHDIAHGLDTQRFGDLPGWLETLKKLPHITPDSITLDENVSVTGALEQQKLTEANDALRALIPWRKGPYDIHGIKIDTEWRSDWKWQRIRKQIAPLKHRLVLDVGCGNGYHGWRMLGDGASRVIGIDPSPRFVVQFQAIKHFLGAHHPIDVLPLGIEHLPAELGAFDTTFSMGVFYHRRSPMDHLRELRATLRPGGQLVLETLIIDGKDGEVLVPEDRYAMMRNVWFLPSVPSMLSWMRKCGLRNPRVVDVCPTTLDEQRSTDWMHFHSLDKFLDPENPQRTVEGHPAPVRAVFLAEAP
ncbi:tRNA 5-methoxyuridine(34)/uridine 5-oxyacetic acid(34) synthase CmoB [Gilvimarinus polysaccharolyticus]|uniref:tRNA 5-methoxyuridine(34)/uridine 5-oxyacetic acid(34) synthase CmoB n=1 Tax=Gilvimarinus polysaccharolyticus TaxID=863921 RepID=UPI00067344B5|nr:tRNA 5-methoxyuridine(34)/uridine 5-oxyacetic acid(34) synthase CmoB [Gilvimarinus polysaccharolyticus]